MGREQRVVQFPASAGQCSRCDHIFRCFGRVLTPSDLDDLGDITAVPRLLKRGQRLFREGETLSHLYIVRSGAIKTFKVLPDGDEQILDFHLPGAIIGFDALSNNAYSCHATALDTSSVCLVRFDALADAFRQSLNTQKAFLRLISAAITHEQRLLITLGSKAATQRIAAFLDMLSCYYSERGYSAVRFSLPMSRTEIANYLSLAVETVSRTLTKMNRDGILDISRNEISILDLDRLQQLANESNKEMIAVNSA